MKTNLTTKRYHTPTIIAIKIIVIVLLMSLLTYSCGLKEHKCIILEEIPNTQRTALGGAIYSNYRVRVLENNSVRIVGIYTGYKQNDTVLIGF